MQFMQKYEMTETQAQGIVNSLIRSGFLHAVNSNGGGKDAYVPNPRFLLGCACGRCLDVVEDENRGVPPLRTISPRTTWAGLIAGVRQRPRRRPTT